MKITQRALDLTNVLKDKLDDIIVEILRENDRYLFNLVFQTNLLWNWVIWQHSIQETYNAG